MSDILETKEDIILARIEEKLDSAFEQKLVKKCQGCKEGCCELGSDTALKYAITVDPTPDDAIREVVCEDPINALAYATHIDRGPKDNTRAAAIIRPYTAYLYARHIDKGVREDTRESARRVEDIYLLYKEHFNLKD